MRSVMNITDILKPAEHIPTGLKKIRPAFYLPQNQF